MEPIRKRDVTLFRAYLEENLAEGYLEGHEAELIRTVVILPRTEDLLRILIEKGWDMNRRLGPGEESMDNGWTGDNATPLFHAAQKGYCEKIAILIQAGAEVNARDRAGNTPLMTTHEFGNAEAVQILCKAGADIHARNHQGETAQSLWEAEGRFAEVRHLLSLES